MLRRFIPDTWLDGVLRPLAMALPDGGTYVEFMAPDPRFILIGIFFPIFIYTQYARQSGDERTALKSITNLVIFIVLVFPVWLFSSGNGRYLMPIIMLVGPVLIGLIFYSIPKRIYGLMLIGIVCAIQWTIVLMADPFGVWTLVPWSKDTYFELDVPVEYKANPHIFVTIAGISYSLIAPQFNPESHWIHLDQESAGDRSYSIADPRKLLLSEQEKPILIVPVPRKFTLQNPLPTSESLLAFNIVTSAWDRIVEKADDCTFAASRGLGSFGRSLGKTISNTDEDKKGFWFCSLTYKKHLPNNDPERVDLQYLKGFNKLEALCPDYFPPGQAALNRLQDGYSKHYIQSDVNISILNTGQVYIKYYRRLNPQFVAMLDDVLLPSFVFPCDGIKGREALPWQRD